MRPLPFCAVVGDSEVRDLLIAFILSADIRMKVVLLRITGGDGSLGDFSVDSAKTSGLASGGGVNRSLSSYLRVDGQAGLGVVEVSSIGDIGDLDLPPKSCKGYRGMTTCGIAL